MADDVATQREAVRRQMIELLRQVQKLPTGDPLGEQLQAGVATLAQMVADLVSALRALPPAP